MNQAFQLDPFVPGSSVLHRADPRLKLAGVLGYVLLVGAVPWGEWRAYLALLVLAGAAWRASGVEPRRLFLRVAPVLAFGAFAALGAVFRAGEAPYWQARVLWLDLAVTPQGVRQCGLLMLRCMLSGMVVGVYIAATRFGDTVQALRRLGVPAVLTATLSFVYRYIFVLVDEALRLDRARQCRTLRKPSVRWIGSQVRSYAGLVGTLFLRAYSRSERVYQAMAARGFAGEFPTLEQPRWTSADTHLGAVWAGALVVVALAVWL